MNLPTKQSSLEHVLSVMRMEGPHSEFSGKVFAEILGLMPPAPNIPKAAFFPLSKIVVVSYIDYIIVHEGKVLMTLREKGDPYYQGWHFPGFCRTPEISPVQDCRQKAAGELGENFRILEVEPFTFADHWDDPSDRPHHATHFYHVTKWEGTPSKGEWFSEMPEKILFLQRKIWPKVEKLLRASV
jgi:ADP-ribose pyrophosphatase YjhB (NUDIX family)